MSYKSFSAHGKALGKRTPVGRLLYSVLKFFLEFLCLILARD